MTIYYIPPYDGVGKVTAFAPVCYFFRWGPSTSSET